MAMACIAITRGSPWVVPSVDDISPLPTTIILTGALYVLMSTGDSGGQRILTLCRAAFLFRELKALEASTNRHP